jgi:hypothetical protein
MIGALDGPDGGLAGTTNERHFGALIADRGQQPDPVPKTPRLGGSRDASVGAEHRPLMGIKLKVIAAQCSVPQHPK